VACYYRDKPRFLGHIAELTEPGGLAAIVHRNALFNLFALNQGTIDFVSEEILKDVPKLARQRIADELNQISGLAVPILRDQSAELYRSAENPLDIADLYADAGFSVSQIRYCFIHGAPPRLPAIDGMPGTAELQRRFENRWEGMFLGSQFLVVARHR
jgi:hypothetical protein